MGTSSGVGRKGYRGDHAPGWRGDNPESLSNLRKLMAGGEATRFVAVHALPSLGERFGELTVVGHEGRDVRVQCSCQRDPHVVTLSNLRKGASTRCTKCARAATARWQKHFWGYADIVPDEQHRNRLLNRISACLTRCKPDGHANYGGRGIRVSPLWTNGTDGRRCFLAYLTTLEGWDQPRLEMDRINVNGHYEPGNLRFISKSENAKNKRSVGDLEARIAELEARLRSCVCGAAQQVHDPHG